MAKALEFNINKRIIRQVIYDSFSQSYWISPGTSIPLVVASGNIAFPVVEIQRKFGPYYIKHLYDAENPIPIGEVFGRDILNRLNQDSELSEINGFHVLSSNRARIRIPDKEGSIIGIREREKFKYFLVEYTATDRVLLRGFGSVKIL